MPSSYSGGRSNFSRPRNSNRRNFSQNSNYSDNSDSTSSYDNYPTNVKFEGRRFRSDSREKRHFPDRGFSRNSRFGDRRGGSRFGSRRPKEDGIPVHKFINPAKEVTTEEYQNKHLFADFEVDPKIKTSIEGRGFSIPTAIQDQAINPILEGKDVVGIANTGTGKTAAFLIPLMHKVLQNRNEKALILVPTRELAVQIEQELRAFSQPQDLRLFSVLAVGGMDIRRQISNLRRPFSFLIATPGRLKDLYDRGVVDLSQFGNLVLDEVDRMLDMGFIDDITEIVSYLPSERQTLFFSATMDKKVAPLMNQFLHNPVTISVKTTETAENIHQDVVEFTSLEEKIDVLFNLLKGLDYEKILIFDKTKVGVEDLHYALSDQGFDVVSIHGDKTQSKRNMAIKLFKSKVNILIATDVAARGLDIKGVSHVINYDTPDNYENYVHRIGRTGRANKSGTALTFVRKKRDHNRY